MMRLILVAVLLVAAPAAAVNPDEILDDPVLEARARGISKLLRCVVCQNQSIDDSNAELARDLRLLVRERLVAGDGDQQVLDYVVARYGDFVLLDPPLKPKTYGLWFGPWIIVGIALLVVLLWFLSRRQAAAQAEVPPLSPAERARLDALVDGLAGAEEDARPDDGRED